MEVKVMEQTMTSGGKQLVLSRYSEAFGMNIPGRSSILQDFFPACSINIGLCRIPPRTSRSADGRSDLDFVIQNSA